MENKFFTLIPSVSSVINLLLAGGFKENDPRLAFYVRKEISRLKNALERGELFFSSKEKAAIYLSDKIKQILQNFSNPSLKRVINATGVILHTNLGRAPLNKNILHSSLEQIAGYCNLELDLATGKRSERYLHVEELLCCLTGAEAALVVNNNAAAIMLTLNTLSSGHETIISKGHQIEIGGSFRLPEIMKLSGVKIIEVGTTNRTHLKDYETAINVETRALFLLHTSNYRIVGFTSEVTLQELTELGKSKNIPVIYDLGSGSLINLQKYSKEAEPFIKDIFSTEIDLVTMSGDKAIGGPQCGIILGKNKWISKLKDNHLLRALRCDKITYSILESILKLYFEDNVEEHLPVFKMLGRSRSELFIEAKEIKRYLISEIKNFEEGFEFELEEKLASEMGSGTLPMVNLESAGFSIYPKKESLSALSKRLRYAKIPVMTYTSGNKIYFNLKTIFEDEIPVFKEILKEIFQNG